jgi:hypothetical protein
MHPGSPDPYPNPDFMSQTPEESYRYYFCQNCKPDIKIFHIVVDPDPDSDLMGSLDPDPGGQK